MVKIFGQWFEDLRLKYKLTLSVSVILFLIIAFIYAYFPAKQREAVYNKMNERITYLAGGMALGYGVAISDQKWTAINVIGSWVREDPNFAYYYIFDENNEVIDSFPENLEKREPGSLLKVSQPVNKGNVLEIKVPIYYKEKFLGNVILGMDLADVRAAVRQINTISTVILFFVFMIALLIILFISSLINKPVKSLMDSVNRVITHGDYSERVKSESKDEAGVLASRFNEMIEMIEERDIELKQQYEELQKVNELKDHFLAATTHDLRSPITAILGFTDLILMNGALDEEDRERLKHIRISTDFLAKMVNDILDISSLESGKSQLKRKPLSLTAIIKSSIDTLHYMAMPKDIPIEFVDKAGENDTVRADADALLRVMNNLISNAVKFTPNGGVVNVLLEVSKTGETVNISVTDTGIGIPEEKIPLLFEIYSPVSSSGTAGEKGTGLGLSITRNLVQKHGGDITVSSLVGEGTCFTVKIPLYRVKEEK
ncbi:MAG: HAMP domain-containing histidine kinase [bacterium]|nr:HAMP domain-containing histidine kinase [bacterium]